MAVRRSTKTTKAAISKASEIESTTLEHLAPIVDKKRGRIGGDKWKILAGVLLAIALLIGFWYKTSSWPFVAMVGYRPVTRWEINKMLYGQYGKQAVENRIVELLVANELDKMGVLVSQQEIQTKINEIKASLGENADLAGVLAERGMSQKEFEKQLELQLRVEKAMMSRINISDDEVTKYLEANSQFMNATGEAAANQAREAIKYSKLQEEVGKWIEELKAKGRVWRLPGA